MTNIIKAPIQKIRRKGPNGEYHIEFSEVEAQLKARTLFPDDECNNWALVSGFIELDSIQFINTDEERQSKYTAILGVLFMNLVDGEYKLFSLRKLMPELECW